jgi:hypothetical protein
MFRHEDGSWAGAGKSRTAGPVFGEWEIVMNEEMCRLPTAKRY